MTNISIRVEGLGKRYQIAERERYQTFRDTLARTLSAPWRVLRGRNGHRAAEQDFWSLRNLSFEIREGEAVGIVGRNGAGKTTLLKILARVTRPTEGFAEVHGKIGSLLEVGTGFHGELTGRENIYLNGAILGMRRADILRRFDEIVEFSGVERFLDTPLKHYSSGMQMRLAFSVAAHLQPQILLVDEVLAVGDLQFQKKCMGKMEEVSQGGRTVVFVSHQMNQIRRLCGRAIWLESGELKKSGPTAEVIGAYERAMTSGECQVQRPQGPRVKARFLRWRVARPAPATAAEAAENWLTTMGPCEIEFAVEVNSPLRAGRMGVALRNMAGELIGAWAMENLDLATGIHSLGCSFPTLPLRPGPYSWHTTLWDEDGLLDSWHALPEMLIVTPGHQHPEDEWNGVLNVPCQFLVVSVEEIPVAPYRF